MSVIYQGCKGCPFEDTIHCFDFPNCISFFEEEGEGEKEEFHTIEVWNSEDGDFRREERK